MSVLAFLAGFAGIALMVICIFLSGNVVVKPPKWTPPRYVVEFGDLVDGLADQYQGVLSREQVRATALGVMSARLSVGPVRVGDAGGLPASLRVLIIQAVDAAAERSEVRCARCNVHFAVGCVPSPMRTGPYDGAHVCARCREELGLGEAVPLF